jgi:hypothetical protein
MQAGFRLTWDRSGEWYEQQQRHQQMQHTEEEEDDEQDETDANDMSAAMTLNVSAMSFPPYASGYSQSAILYNAAAIADGQMERSNSFDPGSIDPNLSSAPNPRVMMSYRGPRRHVSISQPFISPLADATSLAPSPMFVQRGGSHSALSQYPDAAHFSNASGPFGFMPFPEAYWSSPNQPLSATRSNIPLKRPSESDENHRVKRPHTIADPSFGLDRLTENSQPQEAPPVMLDDLRGQQDSFLSNIGGGTTAETVTPTAPHQGFRCNITPPENDPETPVKKLRRHIEEEVNRFLEQYRSRADDSASEIPVEGILSRLRLSWEPFVTPTLEECSSTSPIAGEADADTPAGKPPSVNSGLPHKCPVKGCHASWARGSELRKHMQRHAKLFGCTFDDCYGKVFGSKDDWKRHEQRKHEQQDCWRCLECHKAFYHDEKKYVEHMMEVHQMHSLKDTAHNPESRKIARNYQGRFWCGFCDDIIIHHLQGVEAINRRFDHIANHFTKDKMSVRDWIEIGGRGQTKQVRAQQPRPPGADDYDPTYFLDDDMDKPPSPQTEVDTAGSSSNSNSSSSGSQQSEPMPGVQTLSEDFPAASPGSDMSQLASVSFSSNDHDLRGSQTGMTGQVIFGGNPLHPQSQARMPTQASVGRPSGTSPSRRPAHNPYIVTCCQCDTSANLRLGQFCMDCMHEFCHRSCKYKAPACTN